MPDMDVTADPTLPIIRPLSPLVAAQIAAGEVVERPASVVKELIDNAIDAHASRIVIDLEQGGIELIRVTDDGHGMPPDQLPLAIAEHATSKITDAADLDRITTMGFRGEALASIASVSRLSVRSRTASEPAASIIEVEGGAVRPIRPEAGAVGTCITVRNLFFNTPARRKFLRTAQTEQGHCIDAVRALALAHPHIGFIIRAEGRAALDLPPNQGPRDRALDILGRELASQFLEAHADQFDDARGLSLWGLIGLPAIAKPTSAAQHLFVNGRPIRDKTIQHALKEAYRGLIEPGRHPAAVLMILMDPGAVDVNVHPAKAEVRFRDGGLVHSVVFRAVRDALQSADATPAAPSSWGGITPRGLASGPAPAAAPETGGIVSRFTDYFKQPGPTGSFDYESVRARALAEAAQAHGVAAPADPALPRPVPARRVLQVHNSYLVTQDEAGVLIIDQHALHERIMFEKLKLRLAAGPLESQRLLMPALSQATPQRMELLVPLASLLNLLGITAEPIGPMTVAVHAFPTFLFDKKVDPATFTAELLERAEAQRWVESGRAAADLATISEDLLHDILDMMSCKAAIRAGDALSDQDLHELLELRESMDRSGNCPHGRPTTVRITTQDLAKLFGRA